MSSRKITKVLTAPSTGDEEFSPVSEYVGLRNHISEGSKDNFGDVYKNERNTNVLRGLADVREGNGGRRWTNENFESHMGLGKGRSMEENIGNREKYEGEKLKGKDQNDDGELSKLIYFGLEDAREELEKRRIIENLERELKKELELEMVLCREQKRLIMMNIMREKASNCQSPHCEGQEDERCYEINIKEVENMSPTLNEIDEFDDYQRKRRVTEGNVMNKMKKQSFESHEECMSPSFSDLAETMSQRFLHPNNISMSSNSSRQVSPSGSTSPRSKNSSCEKSFGSASVEEKKMLLLKRRNNIRKQLEIERINYDRKEDMIKEEISLLKKEIKQLVKIYREFDGQKSRDISFSRATSIGSDTVDSTQITNTKNISIDRTQSNSREKGFSFQMRLKRPSLFTKAKSNNFIPQSKNGANLNKLEVKSPEKIGCVLPPKPPKSPTSKPVLFQRA